jgi:hypothetical protein
MKKAGLRGRARNQQQRRHPESRRQRVIHDEIARRDAKQRGMKVKADNLLAE